ncbi:unnamed protein product, partial [Angiostrongylus costaricensis]|uniref:Activin_recp domain-containing protein n=1 Tax=Angiostrongylus costaricensis TaxID=334426 RepID=A0A0R3PSG3_ANGCS
SRFFFSGGQVKCFCDRDSCDDNLLCQGDFCFIGLRREDGSDTPKLRQHCGSTGDLCKCEEDFCNTFAYLRSSIDSQQDRRDVIQFTKQDAPYPKPVRLPKFSLATRCV